MDFLFEMRLLYQHPQPQQSHLAGAEGGKQSAIQATGTNNRPFTLVKVFFFSVPDPELPSRTRRDNRKPLGRVPLDVWGSKQMCFFIHIHEELNITTPTLF